jgi:hypothetical protein
MREKVQVPGTDRQTIAGFHYSLATVN